MIIFNFSKAIEFTAYFTFMKYILTGRDAPQQRVGETPKTALLSVPQEFYKIFMYLIYLQNAVFSLTIDIF